MTLNTKLAATALAVASLGVVGAADAATTAQTATKLTISVDDETFTGSLSSSKAKCEPDRKVTLFRLKAGPDQRIGSDVSNDEGDWTVKSGKEGRFYAVVKANKNCLGKTSKRVISGG